MMCERGGFDTVLTGRATEIEVASRAAISVMTDSEAKAAKNRHPGLKAVADSSESIEVDDGFGEAASGFSVEAMSNLGSSLALSDVVDMMLALCRGD
jgi:hypothetical protein